MPSSPKPPKAHQRQHQQQNNGGSATTSTMLNSLVHFLQQNKAFSSSSAAPNSTPVPTFPIAANPTMMMMMDCNGQRNNCVKSVPHEMMCSNNTADAHQQTNGTDPSTTTLFARTVDSLNNFLSPNVVLLPVAFHALADEQHIQLLGMPQTVIPIAIHRAMQKRFAVRPLLVDEAMANHQQQHNGHSSGIDALPAHIAIARAGANSARGAADLTVEDHHFQLPVAFRPSLVHPAQQPQQHQSRHIPVTECTSHAKNEQQQQQHRHFSTASVDKFGEDDGCKTEPLDLSLTTQTKENARVGGGGNGAVVGIQRKKRTNRGGPTEEMGEVGKKTRRMTSESVLVEKRTSPCALSSVGTSVPPSSSGTFLSPLGPSTSAIVPNLSSKDLSPTSTVALPQLPVDSASRKRFLCDLCGDVSFLAMETLIGHKKYYCRNRPRADDIPDSSGPSSTMPAVSNNATNSAATGALTGPSSLGLKNGGSNSSSSPPSASPPVVQCAQCPFQTAHNTLSCQHQKQQHSLPVLCAECGYRAFTMRGLRTHARQSHSATTSADQITANKKAATNGKGNSGEGKTTDESARAGATE